MPISSVLTAAEAISNRPAMPRFFTISFKIYSPMGLRQILPWHKNRIRIKSTIPFGFLGVL